MIESRTSIAPLALFTAAVFAAVYGGLALFQMGVAHADVVTAGTTPAQSIDVAMIVAFIAMALGALSTVLHFVAPRTKTTLDDALRDDIDEVLAFIRGQPPASNKPVSVNVTNVSGPGPTSGTIGMLAVLCLGLAVAQPACGARPLATAGVGAFLDCEGDGIKSTVLELLGLAKAAVMSTISGDGKHVDATAFKAAAKGLKSDAGRCAFASAVAMLATPEPAKPGAPMAAGLEINGAELRAAFEAVRPELGGTVFVTASGTL